MTDIILWSAAGFAVGLFVTQLYFRKRLLTLMQRVREQELAMESERRIFAEKEAFLRTGREELEKAFRSLSSQALTESTQQFLALAKSALENQNRESETSLEKKEEAIRNLVHPMRETLDQVRGRLESIEKDYRQTFTEVKEQFRFLKEDQSKLQLETANLVKALRAPQTRGRWGEIQLRRVVEMAGMLPYVDFVEQATTASEGTKLRPDMLVRLPGSKLIVIDAKTSLSAYLEMIEAGDDPSRDRWLREHGRQVLDHIGKLSAKTYWDQFPESPEFVIMFLPNEGIYGAALEAEPRLIEVGAGKNVIIATPATLIALLKAVAYGWNQENLADHAKIISSLGKELYDRMAVFVEHLENIRKGLDRSVDSYNKAVGALESRVLPSARRFRELGISSDKELGELKELEGIPRQTREIEEAQE